MLQSPVGLTAACTPYADVDGLGGVGWIQMSFGREVEKGVGAWRGLSFDGRVGLCAGE